VNPTPRELLNQILSRPDLRSIADEIRGSKVAAAGPAPATANLASAQAAADDLRATLKQSHEVSARKIAAVRHMLRVGSQLVG
jgi:hypothetical protein